MVVVVEPVGIGKMAVAAAQLTRLLVHQLDEQRHGVRRGQRRVVRHDPAHAAGHCICRVVTGRQYHRVQQALEGQALPPLQIGEAGALLHEVLFVADGERRIRLAIFAGNRRRQQLGHAGGIRALGAVFGIEDRVVRDVVQNAVLRSDAVEGAGRHRGDGLSKLGGARGIRAFLRRIDGAFFAAELSDGGCDESSDGPATLSEASADASDCIPGSDSSLGSVA